MLLSLQIHLDTCVSFSLGHIPRMFIFLCKEVNSFFYNWTVYAVNHMHNFNKVEETREIFLSSVQVSHSVVSYPLRPHGLQHARPPCPSPAPKVYPNSCPLSQWYHPTISSSFVPFSSCPQSFPASAQAAAAKSLQLCPTLCNLIDSSPPDSSVHGIFQTGVLEWVAIAFSILM